MEFDLVQDNAVSSFARKRLRSCPNFFPPPFGPSEAGPMQQLPTRRDADVLLQLKEGITDSVITGIVEEWSEWPIAR